MRVIHGINPVSEALRSGTSVVRVLISGGRADKAAASVAELARARGVEVANISPVELEKMTSTPRHQGVAAILAEPFRYADIDDVIKAWRQSKETALILILDSIQDPQNLGSLIRAAVAAGVHGIIIPKDRACEITPTVVKASAGATEHALIAREVNLNRAIELLKAEGVWVAGIEADAAESIYAADLDRDLAIIVGSEGKGIRRLVRENCDFCVSIPMSGRINSLNAAQAGAVALFEAMRQRMKVVAKKGK